MVRLSALRTGPLYPAGNIPGTHFCYRLSRPQGHSAAGRIMSVKNCSDTSGNRSRDLPACSSVAQPHPADCRAAVYKLQSALRTSRYCYVSSAHSSTHVTAAVHRMAAPTVLTGYNTLTNSVRDSLRVGRSGDRIPVGARSSAPVQTGHGPTQPPVQGVPGLFTVGKAAGTWR